LTTLKEDEETKNYQVDENIQTKVEQWVENIQVSKTLF
jgi:hypothetical protein